MTSDNVPGTGIFKSVKGISRPMSRDITLNHLLKQEILQPKYDGWYAEGECRDGVMVLYSATNTPLTSIRIQNVNYGPVSYRFRGEYMFGTNRAKLDILNYLNYNIYDVIGEGPYIERYKFLEKWIKDYNAWSLDTGNKIVVKLTPNYTTEAFSYLFGEVKAQRLEGIIARSPNSLWTDAVMRYKPNFCMDYVVIDLEEGSGLFEGSVGAIVGGQLKNGEWVPVCKVSGLSAALRTDMWKNKQVYLGRVFEAEGKQVFETGALRHPHFKRWRLDVDPLTVIWKGAENGRYSES